MTEKEELPLRVFKYGLSDNVSMPEGAIILHVGVQGGELFAWALVDHRVAVFERRRFEIIGTGKPVTAEPGHNLRALGTVIDGHFVWHVFELVCADDSKEGFPN